MVAVKAGEVDGALRRRDPRIVLLLIYGPDAGLVGERARAAAEGAVHDPSDPFQLIRLDGEVVASDPARLADEAGTLGLFGAKRAIWIRPTTRNLAPAVEALLASPVQDTLVVIEAGDLAKSSPLRTLCERSPQAMALPCYADSGRDLGAVVDDTFRDAGLTIGREARQALLASLGGDRMATRGELAKLALYVHGRREVTVADIDAAISDVSSLAFDAAVDAAFAGDPPGVDQAFRRLSAEGTHPSVVLGSALRHGLALLAARADVEAGRPVGAAVEGWRGLHFRRKAAVERQLGAWTTATLRHAVERLQADLLETRRSPEAADAVASRTLLALAVQAQTAARQR